MSCTVKRNRKTRRHGAARRWIITAMLVLTGIALMAYPFVSNFLYEHRQQQVIYQYEEETNEMGDARRETALAEAEQYNKALQESHFSITDPFDPNTEKEETEAYEQLLNLSGDGVMGFVEIPAISVYLPILHGTSDSVLQDGVGHLENTSLPVGGAGTHAVLSAHSGLSDKKLFTDLPLLVEGDLFYIHVLGRTMAYQVDQILTVLPYETDALRIVSGQDYVTLLTCTPYGINSHRLLVRGTAVPYTPQTEQSAAVQTQRAPSQWMRQYAMAMATGLVLLACLVAVTAVLSRRRRNG